MNQYLVDHTRDHLIAAANFAATLEVGDLRIQILAQPGAVHVRACAGGVFKTWISDGCDWDELATAAVNPLIAVIRGVIFRLERQCRVIAGGGESVQKGGNAVGEQNTARD